MKRAGEIWAWAAARLLTLPPLHKQIIMICADVAALLVAGYVICMLALRTPLVPHDALIYLVLLSPLIAVPAFWLMGVYKAVVHLWSARQFLRLGVASSLATVVLLATLASFGKLGAFWNLAILLGGTVFLTAVALRSLASIALRPAMGSRTSQRVVIYGAGVAGAQLAAALQSTGELMPLAFMDDKRSLQGRVVQGLKVYAPDQLKPRLAKMGVGRILLAVPSASQRRRTEIVHSLEDLRLQVMLMPSLDEIAKGLRRVDELRHVQIEDVLGRDCVAPDPQLMDALIRDRVVMVTGAGGSIGSELARQVMQRGARTLVLLDICEYNLYQIDRELRDKLNGATPRPRIVPVLESVLHREAVSTVLWQYKVQTVYHAAAYKHVPLVEANALSGIKNNVIGTLNIVEAAAAQGVEHFVLVSTDKAVRPTSIMGASKRVAELVAQAQAERSPDMRMAIVRFGNVLASSGSVIPLFQQQLAQGGPITVTHPEVTRYFMTMQEAAQLVIQAGAMGHHGEVFLLEMGQPVRIVDLARRLIHLSGLHVRDQGAPDGDIEIVFTGLRPGEKLYEELLIDADAAPTPHSRIYRAKDGVVDGEVVERVLADLERHIFASRGDVNVVKELVRSLATKVSSGGNGAAAEAKLREPLTRPRPEVSHRALASLRPGDARSPV